MLSACGVAAQAAGLIERGLCFSDEKPASFPLPPFAGTGVPAEDCAGEAASVGLLLGEHVMGEFKSGVDMAWAQASAGLEGG